MHGNVREWCLDWHSGLLPGGGVTDPQSPATGSYRVYRGGSWDSLAFGCRSAYRDWDGPERRDDSLGFRVALVSVP
jgi:formylglycine-generating enzyme